MPSQSIFFANKIPKFFPITTPLLLEQSNMSFFLYIKYVFCSSLLLEQSSMSFVLYYYLNNQVYLLFFNITWRIKFFCSSLLPRQLYTVFKYLIEHSFCLHFFMKTVKMYRHWFFSFQINSQQNDVFFLYLF